MLIFQFTLPREERRQVQAQPLTLQNFNPRSHERSDHITQSFVFRFFNFNPRSHERSDGIGRRGDHLLPHFNPRSHERSDMEILLNVETTEISIHAPTRGATHDRMAGYRRDQISIHAPTRGATDSETR